MPILSTCAFKENERTKQKCEISPRPQTRCTESPIVKADAVDAGLTVVVHHSISRRFTLEMDEYGYRHVPHHIEPHQYSNSERKQSCVFPVTTPVNMTIYCLKLSSSIDRTMCETFDDIHRIIRFPYVLSGYVRLVCNGAVLRIKGAGRIFKSGRR
ncbi:hypothetical protein BDD12DRAFT_924441 [Trichophaea hybrida]|nr:hypothetical protein BDD12DRAFT_924441 [Trichophaea hybrida]